MRRLVERFYDLMGRDEPALARLHVCDEGGQVARESRDRFALFLIGWLGGRRTTSRRTATRGCGCATRASRSMWRCATPGCAACGRPWPSSTCPRPSAPSSTSASPRWRTSCETVRAELQIRASENPPENPVDTEQSPETAAIFHGFRLSPRRGQLRCGPTGRPPPPRRQRGRVHSHSLRRQEQGGPPVPALDQRVASLRSMLSSGWFAWIHASACSITAGSSA